MGSSKHGNSKVRKHHHRSNKGSDYETKSTKSESKHGVGSKHGKKDKNGEKKEHHKEKGKGRHHKHKGGNDYTRDDDMDMFPSRPANDYMDMFPSMEAK